MEADKLKKDKKNFKKDRLTMGDKTGNRSSVDEGKSDGPEDETTVVEPEQGNGEDILCYTLGTLGREYG